MDRTKENMNLCTKCGNVVGVSKKSVKIVCIALLVIANGVAGLFVFQALSNQNNGMPSSQVPVTPTHINVGDIIEFGNYTGLVLDVQDDKALIITENIIKMRTYHDMWVDVTWVRKNFLTAKEILSAKRFDEADACLRKNIFKKRVDKRNLIYYI